MEEEKSYYYAKDHLGTIRTTINMMGETENAMDYFPYGEEIPDRSIVYGEQAKYKFTGKERDEETGYDYFGARYYNSKIGRWLSVDPLADKYPGWSPYNYVSNNPLVFIDQRGDSLTLLGTSGDISAFTQSCANKLGGFYNVTADKNGLVNVAATNMIGPMTSDQSAFYSTLMGAASMEVGNVTIGITQDESAVLVDLYDYNQIDIGDFNKMGDLSSPLLGHALAEQTEKQLNNLGSSDADFNRAHSVGLSAEEAIYGASRTSDYNEFRIVRKEKIQGGEFPIMSGFMKHTYSNGKSYKIIFKNGNVVGVE